MTIAKAGLPANQQEEDAGKAASDDRGFVPGDLLTPDEAAAFCRNELRWKISKSTLAKYRCQGGGPPYRRLRTQIRYDKNTLREYVLSFYSDEMTSTSDMVDVRKVAEQEEGQT